MVIASNLQRHMFYWGGDSIFFAWILVPFHRLECDTYSAMFICTICTRPGIYCRFGNFRENFIFAIAIKTYLRLLKFATKEWFSKCTYISKLLIVFAISRWFYIHVTSPENNALISPNPGKKVPQLPKSIFSYSPNP